MAVIALFPDFYQGLYDRLTGGWGHDLTANQWLGTVIAVGVLKWIGIWLILLWRPLRLALTPRAIKAQRVSARANDLFRVGTEARTIGAPASSSMSACASTAQTSPPPRRSPRKIGRATCRETGWPSVWVTVCAGAVTNKSQPSPNIL